MNVTRAGEVGKCCVSPASFRLQEDQIKSEECSFVLNNPPASRIRYTASCWAVVVQHSAKRERIL